MRPAWLVVLCGYLAVWVPLNFAALATQSLPSIGARGAAAVLELAVHGAAALLCAAAGWMLWSGHAAGAGLARAALTVNAIVAIQALRGSALPRDVPPGLAAPLAVITIAHAAAWIVYLGRSRRLRVWLREV